MTFTMEEEVNSTIIFLVITICKTNHNISFNIHNKPTATDIIMNAIHQNKKEKGNRSQFSK